MKASWKTRGRCAFLGDSAIPESSPHSQFRILTRNHSASSARARRVPIGGTPLLGARLALAGSIDANMGGSIGAVRYIALLSRVRPLEEALAVSDLVTEITHDHSEGMKGTRAVTEALQGEGAGTVRHEIANRYGYDLGRSVDDIRPSHRFDVTC